MAGMKSGAGDDPFADVAEKTDEQTEQSSTDEADTQSKNEVDESPRGKSDSLTNTSEKRSTTDKNSENRTNQAPVNETSAERESIESEASKSNSSRAHVSVDDLPYIARRNVRGASVKTGRDKNVLFELRPEIARREDEFVAELERRIGTDVPKTDAREAALAAIWNRPELVVPILEEWGLGYFEE